MNDDNPDNPRPLFVRPPGGVSRYSTSDAREAGREADFLRGLEQGLVLASHLVKTARSRRSADWDLTLAVRVSGELRCRGSTSHATDHILARINDARKLRRRRA
jgi:hypothetical protein